MTTSKDKTSKISSIVGFTPVSTTTTKDVKDSKMSTASKVATPQQSAGKGVPAHAQTKTSDEAWQKRIGAAHKVWSKLSESELKKSAGEPEKLAELVQTRYSISRSDADKQVRNFIDNRN
ncbi:hypothetical protein [Rheinheimera sp. KL1]|uniref:hypothetical protein n=1 Tax=Rheinheimera sp. KL1 TaxID=1635005 RepID=UPI000B290DA2|nr:hypothetical protein [Rheinheimera sp. KL1]